MKQTDNAQIEKSRTLLEELKSLRGGKLAVFQKKIANDPDLLNAFIRQYVNCTITNTHIPAKYRELMIMAIGCARGVETTFMTHGQKAIEKGASLEEIGEVLRLVFLLCGATALIPAAELFEELESKE